MSFFQSTAFFLKVSLLAGYYQTFTEILRKLHSDRSFVSCGNKHVPSISLSVYILESKSNGLKNLHHAQTNFISLRLPHELLQTRAPSHREREAISKTATCDCG